MRRKLLLADDSPTIQRVIELTFAAEAYDVSCVSDGQQAIDAILADPPDVVVADIDMPEKSGYEVSSFVKDAPHLRHIPVVLLTGAFEPIDEAKAQAARADAVLAKPFEPRAVVDQVRALVAAPARVGESAATGAPVARVPHAVDAESESVDEYLDRLDAAFASLGSASPNREPSERVEVATGDDDGDDSADHESTDRGPFMERWTLDSAEAIPATPIPMVPVAADADGHVAVAPPAPPEAAVPLTPFAPERVALAPPVETPRVPRPVVGADALPLADAFEELLATEQGEARFDDRAATSDTEAFDRLVTKVADRLGDRRLRDGDADDSDVAMSDELVERVASRVLERMSGSALRETVADVVLNVADRLVREEIERLKGDAR